MRISDKIKANQSKLVALKAELAEHTKSLESDENNMDIMNDMDSVMNEIEVMEKSTSILRKTEKISSEKAVAVVTTPATVVATEKSVLTDFMVKSALTVLEAHATGITLSASIQKRYSNDAVMKKAGVIVKGQQDPAFTNVAEWAQELVQDGFGAFMDLIAVDSIVGQLPLSRYTFANYGSLKIPTRAKRYPDDKNLAGAWTAEGSAIRIGAATLGSVTLSPKKLAVIGTFSREIFERSTPNIESLIRRFMIEDTTIAIDTQFISATAATTVAPGGVLHGVTPIVSGGSTPDKIAADLSAAITAMIGAGGGVKPYFIMNPALQSRIAFMQNSVGTPAFPEAVTGNNLRNIPVVTSLTVPATTILLVDADSIGIAGGTPQFLGSNQATLHEEYVAADTKPIVGAGTGTAGATDLADIANPVRSLYQTDSLALRMVMDLDWSVLRDPAASAQVITTIA